MPADLANLVKALDPTASLSARLDALEDLLSWAIQLGGLNRLRAPVPFQLARIEQLVQLAETRPDLAETLSQTFASVFRDTSAVSLFADAGIPGDRGFLRETVDRVAKGVLPQPPDDEDLEQFMARVFRKTRDCAWIMEATPALIARIGAALGPIFAPLLRSMEDALSLLCTRVSALGLSPQLRPLASQGMVRDSAFFRITHCPLDEMPMVIAECRAQLALMHKHLEVSGVSVDVVFRLDSIRRMLLRAEKLCALVAPNTSRDDRIKNAQLLLGVLTVGRISDTSLRQLARQNLSLLARRVIERVGQSTETYVTSSRREWWSMFVRALGGGGLVAFTVILRFLIQWQQFAPFLDFTLSTANYAGSFLVLQVLGLTLAAKQPTMTATALARTITQTTGTHQLDELVAMIARISRTQFAAALGNTLAVVALAIGVDLLYQLIAGHSFVDPATARATIASFDPIGSGTIFYAAVTGALIWLSSVAAGWFENWLTYNRLPDAIRQHRVGRFVGRERLVKFGDLIARGAADVGGNVFLGVLFAITPMFGSFMGLPLDVRHLTLATGSLTFSISSLGIGSLTVAPIIGIVLIGLLNFGVSFVLALSVALQARDVGTSERLGLAVAVLRRFVRHPLEFFVTGTHA